MHTTILLEELGGIRDISVLDLGGSGVVFSLHPILRLYLSHSQVYAISHDLPSMRQLTESIEMLANPDVRQLEAYVVGGVGSSR